MRGAVDGDGRRTRVPGIVGHGTAAALGQKKPFRTRVTAAGAGGRTGPASPFRRAGRRAASPDGSRRRRHAGAGKARPPPPRPEGAPPVHGQGHPEDAAPGHPAPVRRDDGRARARLRAGAREAGARAPRAPPGPGVAGTDGHAGFPGVGQVFARAAGAPGPGPAGGAPGPPTGSRARVPGPPRRSACLGRTAATGEWRRITTSLAGASTGTGAASAPATDWTARPCCGASRSAPSGPAGPPSRRRCAGWAGTRGARPAS